jgi:hypothetical protein
VIAVVGRSAPVGLTVAAYESPINYQRQQLSNSKSDSVHLSTEPG